MPYTLGGATTDDITFTAGNVLIQTGTTQLITGWWKPTTLTATRKLWSVNSTGIAGAEIDATTSSIRLKTDNTTDGQWTAPVGLTVNEWKFLAMIVTCNNTGPAGNWRVFHGTPDVAPVEAVVTVATAPVGNFVGSSAFYIGNAGTGSLAFQGLIADVCVIGESATADASIFGLAAHGTFNTQSAFLIERAVHQAWAGMYQHLFHLRTGNGNDQGFYGHMACDGPAVLRPAGQAIATVNGATLSEEGGPRPLLGPPLGAGQRRTQR